MKASELYLLITSVILEWKWQIEADSYKTLISDPILGKGFEQDIHENRNICKLSSIFGTTDNKTEIRYDTNSEETKTAVSSSTRTGSSVKKGRWAAEIRVRVH